jgi:hypothetical protein
MDNVTGSPITAAVDEISGGINLTFTNKTQVTGTFDYGLSGGSPVYPVSLDADTAFKAISMWIRRINLVNYGVFASNAAGTGLVAIKNSSNGNWLYFYNGTVGPNTSLPISDTNWHHVMLVEGSTPNYHWLWLDGVKDTSERLSNLAGVIKYLSRPNNAAGQENVELDNVQWYDRIPTDEEIAYLAAATAQTQTLPIPPLGELPIPPLGETLYAAISQPYSLWPDPFQATSEQLYTIADPLDEIALEQRYSMVLEIWLTQHYGDVPVIGTSLAQYYGSAPVLTRWLEQRWDHAPELEVSLDQPWSLPDMLQAVSVQSYGIAAEVLTVTCDQLYHINANTTLFASLIQPYIIAAETARLYQFDTRLYIDGERVPYHALEWQATETEFVWSCDFSVKDLAIAAKCVDGAAITIVSAGDTWQLKCYGGWLLDKRHADTVYRISGYSQPWDLSQAPPLLGDIDGGMASAIVAGLASPHGIAIDWQMVDGYIASGKITANDQAPSELIKDIVHDGGGIVLSTPAGGLLVVAEEEIPVPDWPTTTPAQIIEAVLERISTSEQRDEQKGYNSFDVSDQLASGDSYRLEENLIDSRTKELRLFLVPIAADQQYVLTHSSDSGVSVEPFGIVSLQINDELVEFVAGSGRTSKPMYGLSGSAWQKENLGAVTWSEDGVLTAATAGYSLLKISYVTMFRKWIARDPRIEDVQFRAEKVTA